MYELSVKQVLWFSGSLVLGLAACAAPQKALTRPSYSFCGLTHLDFGSPLNVEALVAEYPILEGTVFSASGYEEHLPPVDLACDHVVEPGAVLDIEVVGEADLSMRRLYVSEGGTEYLPYIGAVDLVGHRPPEIRGRLEAKYGALLKCPEVSVRMLECGACGFAGLHDGSMTILHHGRPARHIELRGGESVLSVLGAPERDDLRAIRVLRRADREPCGVGHIIIVDAWAFIKDGDVRQDLPLRSGDVVLGAPRGGDWALLRRYVDGDIDLDALIDALTPAGTSAAPRRTP